MAGTFDEIIRRAQRGGHESEVESDARTEDAYNANKRMTPEEEAYSHKFPHDRKYRPGTKAYEDLMHEMDVMEADEPPFDELKALRDPRSVGANDQRINDMLEMFYNMMMYSSPVGAAKSMLDR